MYSTKLRKPIVELSFKERSLLFAELSMIAYLKEDTAYKQARLLGFTTDFTKGAQTTDSGRQI